MGSTEIPSRHSLYTLNTEWPSYGSTSKILSDVCLADLCLHLSQECFVRFLVAGVCICVLNNTCTHSAVPVELGVIARGHEHVVKDRRSAVTLKEIYFIASLPHFMF